VVAVRGGGHSFSGLSTCDDGMVIDLRGLKSITVDPQSRTARAGGGVLWGEFDAATLAHGLHTPGGRVTTTGLGGFTTGGGYGWTPSKYGLACDNLISAEVVLADGSVVRASEHEHADLFWGIRGGGGNSGVVTEFEFRLHPLGPIVLAGLAMFPIDRAPEVLRGWRDWADAAPDEVSTCCVVVTAPPEEFIPPELRGQPVLGHRDARYLFHPITAWLDPADGEKMIAATRAFAAAMRPFSTGASYLNFTHEADRVRDAYGDATYARLVALKDTYDPANLFRLNQNIRPSQPAAEPALA
jgi:FAD/FMN-containing dehydrogenase